MKKLFYCLLIAAVFYSGNTYPQIGNPVRLTNGNNDRNPSFCTIISYINFGYIGYEFMVFERVSGAHTQICVSKIGPEGAIDSTHYLTNDSGSNTNPVIFYNKPVFPGGNLINLAFVVWQSDKFGRESIFGSFYDIQNGWSEPFAIDTSDADNKKPSILGVDDPYYIIAYESGYDIKYKKFNRQTHETAVERNLTLQEPEICSNPQLTGNINSVFIAYEKEFSSSQKAIYFRSGHADSIPYTGNLSDTLVFTDVNHIVGYGKQSLMNHIIFETNKNGNIDLFAENLSNHLQYSMVVNNAFDNLGYAGTDIVITDAVTNFIFSYMRKSSNALRFILAYNFNPLVDVLSLKISSNPLYRSKISVGNGVRIPDLPCQKFWFVYNKDSVNINYPSLIFGIPYTNCLTEINQNIISHPDDFSLSQNYPNPFNPVTHLEFGISDLEFVSLKVYNVLGNEIKTLVNEMKTPGVYDIEFDGSNLPSGIYYYSLLVNGVSVDTKKMILLR